VIIAAVCFWQEYENDVLLWPLGLVLFLAGWAVRIWAQQHVGCRPKSARALATSGPYAVVRNPLYLGNTLIILGPLCCQSSSDWRPHGALVHGGLRHRGPV
jgi:protein-S-isoprenylcysteine O-methyltransferase Ste14